jgi:protease I
VDAIKVVVLAADLFEDIELLYPVYRLREENVDVTIAGFDDAPVTGEGPRPGVRRRACR